MSTPQNQAFLEWLESTKSNAEKNLDWAIEKGLEVDQQVYKSDILTLKTVITNYKRMHKGE